MIPIVVFGSEILTLTKRAINRATLWRVKLLRKISGLLKENGIWRMRTGRELQELYKSKDVTYMQARRI